HEVIGLARSDQSAAVLELVGATVHRGDLEDLKSLSSGAASADAVIHTAFNHDFSQYVRNCENDRKVIEALGSALVGTEKPILITSGTVLLKSGVLGRENDLRAGSSKEIPRAASEEAAEQLVFQGVRASIVRLSPSVHGEGDHGFVPALIAIAREKGVSAYIGDGANRWPAVHRLDVASLFRLALEQKPRSSVFHAAAEEGVATKDIASAIGKGLNLPVVSISADDAAGHFGWLAPFFSKDAPTSSEITRTQLGWKPKEAGLIQDLSLGRYFR
ncbi:MAG: SDR family oxidoreductase, partial [Proteobacteria bacterium]